MNDATDDLSTLFQQQYETALTIHGNLELTFQSFALSLEAVVTMRVNTLPPGLTRLSFASTLHTSDLYLSLACALPSEKAWERFRSSYQQYIFDLCAFTLSSRDIAGELASNILSDMFLPDRSGKSRIASYDGRTALPTWLRAVVTRRAINEGRLKWNQVEFIDALPDLADEAALKCMEDSIRQSKYSKAIKESLAAAVSTLSERERLMLRLRYDDLMRAREIAERLGTSPSSITRLLQKTYDKLRKEVISSLCSRHNLGDAAIEECRSELLENSSYSLVDNLKTA
jgi:RNA polymerase sigma-70 factor